MMGRGSAAGEENGGAGQGHEGGANC